MTTVRVSISSCSVLAPANVHERVRKQIVRMRMLGLHRKRTLRKTCGRGVIARSTGDGAKQIISIEVFRILFQNLLV